MTEKEKLTTAISALVSSEIDGVDKVEKIDDKKSAVIIIMKNGKRYMLRVTAVTFFSSKYFLFQ